MRHTVLITGGAGFIGSHTANDLAGAGHRVRVIDNLDPQIHGSQQTLLADLHPDIEFVHGDIRDPDVVGRALEDVDVVFHLAALTGVTQSMYEIERYIDVNVRGTAALWDAILSRRVRLQKFVLASSRAIYGEGTGYCRRCSLPIYPEARSQDQLSRGNWDPACPSCGNTIDSIPTSEDKPAQPVSIYGQSKLYQEGLCSSLARTQKIPLVILRYFNVYGPYQSLANPYTGIAPAFCSRLRAGKPISLYEDGLAGRDFIHIRDVVTANRLAMMSSVQGEAILNIGSGVRASILDLARAICAAMTRPETWTVTGQYRSGDVRNCYADTSRAERELGFLARTTLQEGIADLVEWVLTNCSTFEGYEDSVRQLESKGVIFGDTTVKSSGNA